MSARDCGVGSGEGKRWLVSAVGACRLHSGAHWLSRENRRLGSAKGPKKNTERPGLWDLGVCVFKNKNQVKTIVCRAKPRSLG